MNLSAPFLWFLAGVLFLLAELMMPGFILIFFAAGCWLAALTALAVKSAGLNVQIAVFILSSLLLLFTLRKYSLRTFGGEEHPGETYSDSKIGKTAVVTRTIRPDRPGEIKTAGSFWRAVADEVIEEGQSVIIEKQEAGDALTFRVKTRSGTGGVHE